MRQRFGDDPVEARALELGEPALAVAMSVVAGVTWIDGPARPTRRRGRRGAR
jgi:hypothetical protein